MILFCALMMMEQWKVADTGVFQPLNADEVVVREDGHVFVLNFDDAEVIHYGADGKKVGVFGRKGKGPGEFTYPVSFIYRNGTFYIQDALEQSISVFDKDGVFKQSFKLPARSLALGKSANGWVYGTWNTFGMVETEYGLYLVGDTFEDKKTLMTLDDRGFGQGMSVTNNNGQISAQFSPLSARPRLVVSPDGKKAYVSDVNLFKIHIFDLEKGEKTGVIDRKEKRIPFDDDWAQEQLARRDPDLPSGVKVKVYTADFFPAIRDMKMLPDGTLVFDRWRGRPDQTHHPLALTPDGKETRLPYNWETILRLAGVNKGYAYITMYNVGDEEGWVARVPVAQADKFVADNPEDPEAERNRSISISN
ncbi:MAG: 6-bladed beta-propeller [Acidobacteriota bacterium]|nr:6-bladed beta-propeller [Acidobacteriota bacterium]